MPLNGNSSANQPRRWWTIALVVLVTGIVLLAIATRRDDSIPIRTSVVQQGTIRSVISTNGRIEPVNNFEAHAPISTSVRRLLVREGEQVRKGQLLVELDDSNARTDAARAQTALSGAQASLSAVERGGNQEEVLTLDAQIVKARTDRDSAQRNLESLKKLQPMGAASVGEVRDAENAVARAEAELNLLQQKQVKRYSKAEVAHVEAQRSEAQAAYAAAEDVLSKSNVRAPFDGIVYFLPVKQGAFVNAGDLLLQVADLRKVQVRAFIDEPDVARLALGDPMEITWDAIPERIWKTTLSMIPSTVRLHGARNVGETTCIVDNADLKLLPNINIGVTIVTGEHENVLVVPREAVRVDDTTPYVLLVSGDQLQRRNVETALSNLTQVEVRNGLVARDRIALASLNGKPLGEKTKVRF